MSTPTPISPELDPSAARLTPCPYWSAVAKGDIDEVRRLVEQGVPVQCARSDSDQTLLYAATSNGFKRAEKAFLAIPPALLAPMVQVRRHNGWLPIHDAIKTMSEPLVSHMLKAGCDINARTSDGLHGLEIIGKFGMQARQVLPGFVRAMEAMGSESVEGLPGFFVVAIEMSCAPLIERLAAADSFINELEKSDTPSLIRCIQAGSRPAKLEARISSAEQKTRIIKCLAGAGANLEARDSKGWTALHHAVFTVQPELVRTLLVLGADINACGQGGLQACHIGNGIPDDGWWIDPLSDLRYDREHVDVVTAMLDHGPALDPDQADAAGRRPFENLRVWPEFDMMLRAREQFLDLQRTTAPAAASITAPKPRI